MTSPKQQSVAVKASTSKFLSYFVKACAAAVPPSSTNDDKAKRNTLIICSTRNQFIQQLLDEYDTITGDDEAAGSAPRSPASVRSIAAVVRAQQRSDETDPATAEEENEQTEQQQSPPQTQRLPSVIQDSEGENSEISSVAPSSRRSSIAANDEEWPPSPEYSSQHMLQQTTSSPLLSPRVEYDEPQIHQRQQKLPFPFNARISDLSLIYKSNVNVVFCPTLPHLRAYISSLSLSLSSPGVVGVYGMIQLHSPLELSVQGISRTLAAAVDTRARLVIHIDGEEGSATMLKLANVGMVGKGFGGFGSGAGDGFEQDEGDEGEVEDRWAVPLEDVLGRWVDVVGVGE